MRYSNRVSDTKDMFKNIGVIQNDKLRKGMNFKYQLKILVKLFFEKFFTSFSYPNKLQ